MSVNLLEKARQNRIAALETLERRRNNIFLFEDAPTERARRGDSAVFIRRREAAVPAQIAPLANTNPLRVAA